MTQSQGFHSVRDRETLVRLPSGIEIIRAMKHEPISFEGMSKQQIKSLTNKVNGSKFAAGWTLERYVQWMSSFIGTRGWTFPPSQQQRERAVLDEIVGVADGAESHTIEIVVRGRYAHAYPIEDP